MSCPDLTSSFVLLRVTVQVKVVEAEFYFKITFGSFWLAGSAHYIFLGPMSEGFKTGPGLDRLLFRYFSAEGPDLGFNPSIDDPITLLPLSIS